MVMFNRILIILIVFYFASCKKAINQNDSSILNKTISHRMVEDTLIKTYLPHTVWADSLLEIVTACMQARNSINQQLFQQSDTIKTDSLFSAFRNTWNWKVLSFSIHSKLESWILSSSGDSIAKFLLSNGLGQEFEGGDIVLKINYDNFIKEPDNHLSAAMREYLLLSKKITTVIFRVITLILQNTGKSYLTEVPMGIVYASLSKIYSSVRSAKSI